MSPTRAARVIVPSCGRVDAGEGVEQRGLAGAVGPDDREDLAAVHLQGDVVQRGDAAEAEGDVLDVVDDLAEVAGVFVSGAVAVIGSHPFAGRHGRGLGAVAFRPGPRARPCRRLAGIRPAGRKIIISRMTAPIHIWRSSAGTWSLRNSGSQVSTAAPAIAPGQRAHAAEDDVGDDQDRVVQQEVVRADHADLAGEEHTGHAGGRGADREGEQLDPGGVDAGGLRRDLVLTDGRPGPTRAGSSPAG